MSKYLSSEDAEILNDFINESAEAIESVEALLIELENKLVDEAQHSVEKIETLLNEVDDDSAEKTDVDPKTIDEIFRAFHSIKGSAAFLELSLVVNITHEAETHLDKIRKGKVAFSREYIVIYLKLCDVFNEILTHLRHSTNLSDFEQAEENVLSLLREMESSNSPSGTDTPDPITSAAPAALSEDNSPDDQSVAPETVFPKDFFKEALVTPEMSAQFVVESRELLDEIEEGLLALESTPGDIELASAVFRAMHSIKGNAALFECHDIAKICHQIETFMDAVRSNDIQAETEQFSFLLQILDFIRVGLDNFESEGKTTTVGLGGVLDLIQDNLGWIEAAADVTEKEPSETPDLQKVKTNVVVEVTNDSPESSAISQKPTPEASKETTNASPATPIVAQKSAKLPKTRPTDRRKSGSGKSGEVIRVDVAKLNELMDLVGEIVIAESMVEQHPDVINQDLPGFEKAAMHLQKNIRNLQEMTTALRMVPLSSLFRRMIRLVRDVSNKVGKKVELVIRGGETEVDRTVIESISDPLVHIIRNSIDHGLELPEERVQQGKSPSGQVILEAKQIGGEILINIEDNGRGLNREKILEKAWERNLIQDNGDEIADSEVWKMILMPGFSTAEQLTDLSGRGVGMDVVLKNIESIRGRVEIESEAQKGTKIILRIPLTTAIIDGMLMRVENSIYALPMMDIKESLEIRDTDIVKMISGEEVIKIREHIYPVLRIHELHGLSFERKNLTDGLVVLTENGGKSVCLFVDELIGQKQLVVKPLPDYIGTVPGVSGCTILGNGDICQIFDIANLIKLTEAVV